MVLLFYSASALVQCLLSEKQMLGPALESKSWLHPGNQEVKEQGEAANRGCGPVESAALDELSCTLASNLKHMLLSLLRGEGANLYVHQSHQSLVEGYSQGA